MLFIITTIIVATALIASIKNQASVNGLNTEKTIIKSRADLIHKKSLSSKYQYHINHNAYGVEHLNKATLALQINRLIH